MMENMETECVEMPKGFLEALKRALPHATFTEAKAGVVCELLIGINHCKVKETDNG